MSEPSAARIRRRLASVAVATIVLAPPVAAQGTEGGSEVALEATEENARAIERYNAAILAAQEGRLDESIEQLEAFLAGDPPDALRARASAQLELIRAERRKQHTVEFNAAVKHLKKKELEQAEALLQGILEDDPDEKMRRSVEKQLTIIARVKPRRALIVGEDDADDETDDTRSSKDKKKSKRKKSDDD